jgi:hypothetical protein
VLLAELRDLRIQKLRDRNEKLQEEVVRVERALSGLGGRTSYGLQLPQLRGEVLRKELENAYKQIKQYEYEVGKRRKLDFEGAFLDQYLPAHPVSAGPRPSSPKSRPSASGSGANSSRSSASPSTAPSCSRTTR